MSNPLPKGCGERYQGIVKRAEELGAQFVLGNRTIITTELFNMEPLAAAAVAAIMVDDAIGAYRKSMVTWFKEIA